MATELTKQDAIVTLNDFVVEVNGEPRIELEASGSKSTIEPREVYSFERDILDDLINSVITGNASGAAYPIKGRWIHGWLNVNGEDYINGIWKGYRYFLKYVQVETEKVENISRQDRRSGTYDSMYRYLLILEDLDLIERYRREDVPESQYDFNVPEEFRTRTYIRLTANYEDNKKLWSDPVGSKYVDENTNTADTSGVPNIPSDPEDDTESSLDDLLDQADIDSESKQDNTESDEQLDEPPQSMDEMLEETGNDGTETQESDIDAEDLEPTPPYKFDSAEVHITDFEDFMLIPPFINQHLAEAVNEAFSEAPMVPDELEPSDIELGRVAIVGPWGSGDAIPGESRLNMYIGLDNTSSSMNAGFIPAGVNRILPRILMENDIFGDVFPSYTINSTYSNVFRNQLKSYINTEQEANEYYDYSTQETKEV